MTPRLTYFKRYRMEADLDRLPSVPRLPAGYYFQPWNDDLLDLHAEVKHLSFAGELDTQVFPSLGSEAGCRELMMAIRYRDGFVAGATWLVISPDGAVGTVQGIRDHGRVGAVQNLGVVPGYRGLGLGEALLARALHGFRAAGLTRVYLEVTARNDHAVRMYRRVGFRCRRTFYKPVAADAPSPVGMGL
ncbi:MAG: GNAT family N-acetyltransferase [Gemmataceae bacterium]